jgi:hypothetical protein
VVRFSFEKVGVCVESVGRGGWRTLKKKWEVGS